MIDFQCPNCGVGISAGDEHGGLQASCPSCKAAVVVPLKSAFTAGASGRTRSSHTQRAPRGGKRMSVAAQAGFVALGVALMGGLAYMGLSHVKKNGNTPQAVAQLPKPAELPVTIAPAADEKNQQTKITEDLPKSATTAEKAKPTVNETASEEPASDKYKFWKFNLGESFKATADTVKRLKEDGIFRDVHLGTVAVGTNAGSKSISAHCMTNLDGAVFYHCDQIDLDFKDEKLDEIEVRSFNVPGVTDSWYFDRQVRSVEQLLGATSEIKAVENAIGDTTDLYVIDNGRLMAWFGWAKSDPSGARKCFGVKKSKKAAKPDH